MNPETMIDSRPVLHVIPNDKKVGTAIAHRCICIAPIIRPGEFGTQNVDFRKGQPDGKLD